MLRQIQRCSSTEPYFVQLVPSQSKSNVFYEVHSIFVDDPPEEYTCSCPGFRYNGKCQHQVMAWSDRCLWDQTKGPEEQTEDQRRMNLCPRCGQETMRETVDDGS